MLRWWLLGLVAIVSFSPVRAETPVTRVVKWDDDRVTIQATKAPVVELLTELAKVSGAEVKGEVRTPREADFDLEAVPTKQALERLLGEQNFTLTYEQGRLKIIDLRGGPEAPEKPKAPVKIITKAGDDGQYPETWTTLWRLFDGREKVPVDDKLAKSLGRGDKLPWDFLANNAYAHGDESVRREAVRAGMKAIEADPGLRDAVLAAAGNMSDEDLATFARSICFHRAEDLVGNIVRTTGIAEFRTRGRAVLTELGKRPFEGHPPEEFSRTGGAN